MSDNKMKTNELLQKMFRTTSIKRFIQRYSEHMSNVPFHTYLMNKCRSKGVTPAQIIAKSGIERTHGHHIFSGRKSPSRDKVIQLAFGFEMSYEETQELLKIARKSSLYPKIMRDAIIIIALKRSLSLDNVQTALDELKLPTIGKEGRYE